MDNPNEITPYSIPDATAAERRDGMSWWRGVR